MPEVDIRIAGRSYRIGCGAGEEPRGAELAARIDAEASTLAQQMGQVTEARLLLMSSLLLADKLADAEAALAKVDGSAVKPDQIELDAEREEQIAASLDALSVRIETLVGRVQGTA
ncbi:MAG: cell division protein ZapA [Pseudomonadota bacterium]